MADIPTDRIKRNRDGVTYRDDLVSKMASGLERIHAKFKLPQQSLKDLLECIKMIGDTTPIPFHWDITMYTQADAKTPKNGVSTNPLSLPEPVDGLSENSDDESEEEKDEDESGDEKVDSEGIVIRNDIQPGQTRLVRLPTPEEPWGLGL
jgi:hypothetical protein